MERSSFEVNEDIASPQTLVLVGRKGNGKSATGNSIFGKEIFRSVHNSSGVKSTSELQTITLKDGQLFNVIDTPGLFDPSVGTEFTAKEIINGIKMAVNGIHAFLVVFSVLSRFSNEEEAAISNLQVLFGRKIYNYMIVVFTGGDELDEDDQTLEDFLCGCPKALQETLTLCENRVVLFDNKTKDQSKRANQLENLFSLVKMVYGKNGGMPYNHEMFTDFEELAERIQALKENRHITEQEMSVLNNQMHEDQFKEVFEMLVGPKLKETTLNLERQLAEEWDARVKAEEDAKAAKEHSDEVKRNLKIQLDDLASKRRKEPWKRYDQTWNLCIVL